MISKAKRDPVMQTQRHRDIPAMAEILCSEYDMPHSVLHSILPASIIPSEECELRSQPHQRHSSHACTVIFLSRILPSSIWLDYPFPNQSAKAMHRFEILFTLFLVTQPSLGTAYVPGKPFKPRMYADINRLTRRDCVPAAPNVSASAVGHHRIHLRQLLLTPSRSLRMHAARTIRPIPQHARMRCKCSWARVSVHGLPSLTEVH